MLGGKVFGRSNRKVASLVFVKDASEDGRGVEIWNAIGLDWTDGWVSAMRESGNRRTGTVQADLTKEEDQGSGGGREDGEPLLLTSAAVLKFPMLWVGDVGGDGDEGQGCTWDGLQTVVRDCGVTSFFVEVNVFVLHPGRCFERCWLGVLLASGYK